MRQHPARFMTGRHAPNFNEGRSMVWSQMAEGQPLPYLRHAVLVNINLNKECDR